MALERDTPTRYIIRGSHGHDRLVVKGVAYVEATEAVASVKNICKKI